jgi:hypothetical protein
LQRPNGFAPDKASLPAHRRNPGTHRVAMTELNLSARAYDRYPESLPHRRRPRRLRGDHSGACQRSDSISHLRPDALGLGHGRSGDWVNSAGVCPWSARVSYRVGDPPELATNRLKL